MRDRKRKAGGRRGLSFLRFQGVFDGVSKSFAKPVRSETKGRFAQAIVVEAHGPSALDRLGQRLRARRVVESSLDAVGHHGQDSSAGQRNDGRPAGQSLGRGDTEVFLAGLNEEGAGTVEVPQLSAAQVHADSYGGTGALSG